MKDAGSRYEGCSNKDQLQKPRDGELTVIQQMLNKAHNGLRAIGERGNSLLKMTFKATPSVPASQ